jgi:hypothetical protein
MGETTLALLITQRSQVQILPPLRRTEAQSSQMTELLAAYMGVGRAAPGGADPSGVQPAPGGQLDPVLLGLKGPTGSIRVKGRIIAGPSQPSATPR